MLKKAMSWLLTAGLVALSSLAQAQSYGAAPQTAPPEWGGGYGGPGAPRRDDGPVASRPGRTARRRLPRAFGQRHGHGISALAGSWAA